MKPGFSRRRAVAYLAVAAFLGSFTAPFAAPAFANATPPGGGLHDTVQPGDQAGVMAFNGWVDPGATWRISVPGFDGRIQLFARVPSAPNHWFLVEQTDNEQFVANWNRGGSDAAFRVVLIARCRNNSGPYNVVVSLQSFTGFKIKQVNPGRNVRVRVNCPTQPSPPPPPQDCTLIANFYAPFQSSAFGSALLASVTAFNPHASAVTVNRLGFTAVPGLGFGGVINPQLFRMDAFGNATGPALGTVSISADFTTLTVTGVNDVIPAGGTGRWILKADQVVAPTQVGAVTVQGTF